MGHSNHKQRLRNIRYYLYQTIIKDNFFFVTAGGRESPQFAYIQ